MVTSEKRTVMEKNARIYVAGADTLVGAALGRQLEGQGFSNLLVGAGKEPDLTDSAQVDRFFAANAPQYVFLVAGDSGGILANQKYPADLMLNNLLVQTHVLRSAHQHGVDKLLFLASSCSYPRDCPQPMAVDSLLTGPLEPTNEAYSVAKIAGIKLCQAYRQQFGDKFISAIPANPFGIGDDFSLEDSHVIPALLRRMHQAKVQNAPSVTIWGTGAPRREFIFADDLADACIFALQAFDEAEPLNLGISSSLSIDELATLIKQVVGYTGALEYDTTRPDGMPYKALDSTRLTQLGWRPKTSFPEALAQTYQWVLQDQPDLGAVNVR
ncbi:MAG: GDP-L-fucose synthase family protein [Dehalococcoidia bacterium]